MSQRKIKRVLMVFRGIKTKELKTLFYVRGKAIKGWVSTIGKHRFILAPGRVYKGKE